MAPVLQGLDNLQLLLGCDPCINPDVLHPGQEFLHRQLRQLTAGQDGLGGSAEDADPPGDHLGRARMVSGDHDRTDPRRAAEGHRFGCLGAGRVHHADKPDESQAALRLLRSQRIGEGLPDSQGETQRSQAGTGDPVGDLPDPVAVDRNLAGRVEHLFGASQELLDRPFREGDEPTLRPGVESGHEFAFRVEGNLGKPGSFLPPSLRGNAKGAEQFDQRRLGGIADQVARSVRSGIVAEGQGIKEPQPGRDVGIHSLRGWLRFGGYEILRRDHPIPDGDLLHGHAVLSEGSCFVRTNVGYRAERLHRRQFADQGLLADHLFSAQGQRNGDDGGEGFRNRRHGQGDRREQHQQRRLPPQEAGRKDDGADGQHRIGQFLAEGGQPSLKGGPALILILEQRGDPTDLRLHPCRRHQTPTPAVGDHRAPIGHVLPVAEGQIGLPDRGRLLLDGQGLAGQGSLFDAKLDRLRQADVGRYHVSGLQEDQISGNDLFRGNRLGTVLTDHRRRRGGQFLEGRHGFFGTIFLNETQDGIENHDHGDGDGILGFADHSGNNGSGNQDKDHEVLKLIEQHHRHRLAALFGQCVRSILNQTPTRLLGGEARR